MSLWTSTRSAQVQTWPALWWRAVTSAGTATSRSASRQTIAGALPPSSSATRVRFAAAEAMIALPVSRWPVKETICVSSSATSAAPVSRPPVTRLTTPVGSSACSSISRKKWIVLSGVTSLGLATSVLPVRIAGASLRASTASGKFQGQIAATTPIGARSRWMTSPLRLAGEDLALHAPVPLRGEAQQVLGEVDLALRLAGRLADLADEDLGELVTVGGDDVREHAQVGAARDR